MILEHYKMENFKKALKNQHIHYIKQVLKRLEGIVSPYRVKIIQRGLHILKTENICFQRINLVINADYIHVEFVFDKENVQVEFIEKKERVRFIVRSTNNEDSEEMNLKELKVLIADKGNRL